MPALQDIPMTSSNPVSHSGDNSRPTTDGGVANIGAAGYRATGRSALGEPNNSPASPERMQDRSGDAESTENDDSVPFGLVGNKHPSANKDPQ